MLTVVIVKVIMYPYVILQWCHIYESLINRIKIFCFHNFLTQSGRRDNSHTTNSSANTAESPPKCKCEDMGKDRLGQTQGQTRRSLKICGMRLVVDQDKSQKSVSSRARSEQSGPGENGEMKMQILKGRAET